MMSIHLVLKLPIKQFYHTKLDRENQRKTLLIIWMFSQTISLSINKQIRGFNGVNSLEVLLSILYFITHVKHITMVYTTRG